MIPAVPRQFPPSIVQLNSFLSQYEQPEELRTIGTSHAPDGTILPAMAISSLIGVKVLATHMKLLKQRDGDENARFTIEDFKKLALGLGISENELENEKEYLRQLFHYEMTDDRYDSDSVNNTVTFQLPQPRKTLKSSPERSNTIKTSPTNNEIPNTSGNYPVWWGHEEHVPSKRKKRDTLKPRSQKDKPIEKDNRPSKTSGCSLSLPRDEWSTPKALIDEFTQTLPETGVSTSFDAEPPYSPRFSDASFHELYDEPIARNPVADVTTDEQDTGLSRRFKIPEPKARPDDGMFVSTQPTFKKRLVKKDNLNAAQRFNKGNPSKRQRMVSSGYRSNIKDVIREHGIKQLAALEKKWVPGKFIFIPLNTASSARSRDIQVKEDSIRELGRDGISRDRMESSERFHRNDMAQVDLGQETERFETSRVKEFEEEYRSFGEIRRNQKLPNVGAYNDFNDEAPNFSEPEVKNDSGDYDKLKQSSIDYSFIPSEKRRTNQQRNEIDSFFDYTNDTMQGLSKVRSWAHDVSMEILGSNSKNQDEAFNLDYPNERFEQQPTDDSNLQKMQLISELSQPSSIQFEYHNIYEIAHEFLESGFAERFLADSDIDWENDIFINLEKLNYDFDEQIITASAPPTVIIRNETSFTKTRNSLSIGPTTNSQARSHGISNVSHRPSASVLYETEEKGGRSENDITGPDDEPTWESELTRRWRKLQTFEEKELENELLENLGELNLQDSQSRIKTEDNTFEPMNNWDSAGLASDSKSNWNETPQSRDVSGRMSKQITAMRSMRNSNLQFDEESTDTFGKTGHGSFGNLI
ncbi:hypothetical protein HK098_004718 [Nowakowskiella sp. JEL0407]|nr:hypothetical protein HK098_004718 [Nowakowskiella sp. JEL0407]